MKKLVYSLVLALSLAAATVPANAAITIEERGWCGVATMLGFTFGGPAAVAVGVTCLGLADAS